jgi:hypothetical protein
MQKQQLNVILGSDHKHISTSQDHDLNIAIELAPAKSLRTIAHQSSAAPHLGFVLDCSGSMHEKDGSGRRYIDQMVECASSVTRLLKDTDLVSVCFFSTEVSQVHRVKGTQRAKLKSTIEQALTHPYGNTNMKGGLDVMIDDLQKSKDRPKHLLLFTDGGPTGSKTAVVNTAREAASMGISVSVCGFNDQLRLPYLSQIATAGNGETMRSINERELRYKFAQFTSNAQQTGINNLTLELELHPGFIPQHILRGKPQNQYLRALKPKDRVIHLPLGSINAGSWQLLILNGRIFGDRFKTGETLVKASVSYTVVENGAKMFTTREKLILPVSSERPRVNRRVHEVIQLPLIEVEVQRFEKLNHNKNQEESIKRAQSIIRAYEEIESPEANQLAESFRQTLKQLSKGGSLNNKILNELNDATSTTVGTGRLSDFLGSETKGSHFGDLGDSVTRDVSRIHRPIGQKRKVLRFDI